MSDQTSSDDTHPTISQVRLILAEALGLESGSLNLSATSELLGSIPELDSMAVVQVITALEEVYEFEVFDDEISGETFATLGSLANFVDEKLSR